MADLLRSNVYGSNVWDNNREYESFAGYILFHLKGYDDEKCSIAFILDDRSCGGQMVTIEIGSFNNITWRAKFVLVEGLL